MVRAPRGRQGPDRHALPQSVPPPSSVWRGGTHLLPISELGSQGQAMQSSESDPRRGESWQEHTHLPGAWVGLVHAPEAPGVQSTAHPLDRFLHSLSWELETRVL